VRNDKLGSGIVAVDEQGPVHWAGLLTLHTMGWFDLLYHGLDRSSRLGLHIAGWMGQYTVVLTCTVGWNVDVAYCELA